MTDDMRRLMTIVERHTAPLFHFTSLPSAIRIIESDTLKAKSPFLGNALGQPAVSFTRTPEPDRKLFYGRAQVCFVLDGSLVASKPRYGDRDIAGEHGAREMEQRTPADVARVLSKTLGVVIARNHGMYDVTTPEGMADFTEERPNTAAQWLQARATCEAAGVPILTVDGFGSGWFVRNRGLLRSI